MWKQIIERLTDKAQFSAPVAGGFAEAERALVTVLPDVLKNLLLEFNGVRGEYELGLIWSLEDIVSINLEMRQDALYKVWNMPFEPLLFFADAGNGDQFAFVVIEGVVCNPDIFAWDHETDSRVNVAPSMEKYLEWWLNGQMEL